MLFIKSVTAQIEFVEHQMIDYFDFPISVSAGDIDGDGDIDIIGAANDENQIAWWENQGNQFTKKHIVSLKFGGASQI